VARNTLLVVLATFALATSASVATVGAADGPGPGQLAQAGWACFLPPPFNPNVHCAPPGQLQGIEASTAQAGMFVAFATADLNATSAPLIGTERLIRGDLFHNQPCPTDPPGAPRERPRARRCTRGAGSTPASAGTTTSAIPSIAPGDRPDYPNHSPWRAEIRSGEARARRMMPR
jgi:hypothetical protein